jgi:hypothetical protein
MILSSLRTIPALLQKDRFKIKVYFYTNIDTYITTLDLTLTLFSVNITKAQSTDIDNNREDIQLPRFK